MAGPATTPSTQQGRLLKSRSVDLGCWVEMPGQSFPARPVPASSPQGERCPSTGGSGEAHASVCAWVSSEVRHEVRESPAPPWLTARPASRGCWQKPCGCWQKPSGVSGEGHGKGPPAYTP